MNMWSQSDVSRVLTMAEVALLINGFLRTPLEQEIHEAKKELERHKVPKGMYVPTYTARSEDD